MPSYKTLNLITTGISVVLSTLLLFLPEAVFLLFGVHGNEAAYFISRRASMFFIGYAIICYFSRDANPSQSRRSISAGVGVSMLGFAILGGFEFLRGFAGPGIFLAVSAEVFLAFGYFLVWRTDGVANEDGIERAQA